MRKVIVAIFVAGVAVVNLQPHSYAQQPAQTQLSQDLSIHATTLGELRTWDTFVTAESRSGDLRLRSVVRDPLLPSREVERFDQFYKGIRIWGGDIVRDSERGVPQSVFGELASPDLQLSTAPALSVGDARAALLCIGGAGALLLVEPDLVISRLDSGDHRLAFTGVVSGSGDVFRAFIDAQTGAELLRFTEVQGQLPGSGQTAVGTGIGVLGDRKKLSVEALGGSFIAFDRHRPPVIETFDMRGNLSRAKLLFDGLIPYSVSDLASDSDNTWSDPSVVDAHAHVSWTYDYYFKRFGRSGLDGRNGPINVSVNAVTQLGALSVSNADLNDFAINAFWCGDCGPSGSGIMNFGSGIPPGVATTSGRNYTYFSGALDIAAHELTHAVTEATSGLVYRNESGALNEAFSDMMGKAVEFFYHAAGNGVGQADYILAKDISRGIRAGALNGDRSLANPRLYGDPDHYSGYVAAAGDNGGVHTNSGIPNHAYYLAIEGGTNRTSGLAVQGVGAANRDQIEKVFYRAFTTLLPASATFSTARIATIQSARDLYGAGSAVERAVTQAWDAVGVTNTSSNLTRMTTLAGTIPARDGFKYYAVITMPATGKYQAVLNWSDPTVDLDLMIARPGCISYSCMLSRAESTTRRPETVCVDVRAGEQYWVLLENFTAKSTSFELGQTISPATGTSCALPGAVTDSSSDAGSDKGSGQGQGHAVRIN